MLAIKYETARNLYSWLGCFKKDVHISTNASLSIDNFKHLILSYERQSELHNLLQTTVRTKVYGTTARKTQEYTVKLEWVALMLMGAQVNVNVLDHSTHDKYFGKGVSKYEDIGVTVGTKRPDDSAALPSLLQLRSKIRKITHAKKVCLIMFDNMVYRTKVPDYISRLTKVFEDHGCLYFIRTMGLKAVDTDPYFLALFKERIVVTDMSKLAITRYDPQTTVCEIRTNDLKEHGQIMSQCASQGIEVDYIVGSRLNLEGVDMQCFLPLGVAIQYKGTYFHDNFKLWLSCCKGDTIPRTISPNAKITDVHSMSVTLHSINAQIISNKITKEVEEAIHSKFNTKVNIIIIGNKGTGKSAGSKMLAEALTQKYQPECVKTGKNMRVAIISSDSYGRWLFDVVKRNNLNNLSEVTDELEALELEMISERDEMERDINTTPTWYEMQANKILYDHGVTGYHDYMKLGTRHVDFLVSKMMTYVNERILSDSKLSYTKYYVQLQGVMMDYTVGIFECHFTGESTQIARSDILYNYKPIMDGRNALLGRLMHKGGEVGELLLYDTYQKLLASTSPEVTLSELIGIELGFIALT